MSDFSPSYCEITKAILTPYGAENAVSHDISTIIGAWHVEHGIGSVSLSGSITVLDNEGLLEGLPLRGEESLELEFLCADLQTKREIKAQVHKINDVAASNTNKGTTYTIHWISSQSWAGFKRSVLKAFRDKKISTMCKEVFEQYISRLVDYSPSRVETYPEGTQVWSLQGNRERKFILQDTEGNTNVIIPDYMPTEAIGFLLKRAHSNTNSSSSSWRFFERWDGFYCVSDEWLYERGISASQRRTSQFNYSAQVDMDPENAEEQVRSFSSFKNSERSNPAQSLVNGAYRNTIIEVDLLKHHARRYNYGYNDSRQGTQFTDVTGNKSSWATDIHTQQYANDTFTDENAKQYMMIRDYRDFSNSISFPEDKHFRDIIARRVMYNHHMHSTAVTATTDGRLDVGAGDVINVRIRELNQGSNQIEDNPQLSGKYLVTHVVNQCTEDQLTTTLSLYKFGWAGAGSDTRSGRMGGQG